MELFKARTHVDFMSRRRIFLGISALLIVASVAVFFVRGLNYSIDFTGGTLVELAFSKTPDLGAVRGTLTTAGFHNVVVQTFGGDRDLLIRLRTQPGESSAVGTKILQVFQKNQAAYPDVQLRRTEYVGPEVGKELRNKGIMALIIVTLGILIYVGFRFEWRFAVGGVLAMLHDPILVVGFFAITQEEFSLTVIAALLVIMGYSLNDTVVVFDRMREDLRASRSGDVAQVFNVAINETLSRTVITSFITFMVALSLFLFGGPVIHGFATALVIGVVVGTYSSIFVASPIALWLGLKREHVLKRQFISSKDRNDGARL
ncbi:protein translocase subunit SecF [Acidithiobacillus thiooxidans]|jgi:preprotein translocase subunit SecF|uniref:Protein-export membrane protein SecF n=1 Tax=Acidithiobacillus thiooxidans ATCC 19377 TaxID=637390 RepID=A0A543Q3Z6_ACITH|nr:MULTISPECIES: protein translocase subunit SecF [Acidithiobacillus]MBE7561786.1 protein translocase subunit SecF [Acidithiobacillus sp. HP-6]MBE7568301.1 protein translocase subunit SecF [Acidithiobacillus sp. HP-2]MBU2811451.1 protein translocase subunit SecF [Acidithiobacillus thiooxidans]MDD2750022.1 protein translocase subunit SecF [Acidithiobacillus sp.]MDD5279645.1 protein translocase subunit SecF [Acidithiobacillus sp.]